MSVVAQVEKDVNEFLARQAMQSSAQQQVNKLEAAMLKLPQVEQPLKHHFAPGLYAREILNPKGSLIVTKMHKTCHLHVIVKGKISVWIEGIGVKTFEVKGEPIVGITYPGTRRIIYAHEDTIFMTMHVTDKTNIEEIEKDCVYNSDDDMVPVEANIVEQLKNETQI
jgi:hypothetical protein